MVILGFHTYLNFSVFLKVLDVFPLICWNTKDINILKSCVREQFCSSILPCVGSSSLPGVRIVAMTYGGSFTA